MWFRMLLRRMGAALVWGGVLAAGLWFASGWWQFSVSSKRGVILLSNGTLTLDGNALAINWKRPEKELSVSVQLIPDRRPAWTLWRWFKVNPPSPFYLRVGVIPLPPTMSLVGGAMWWLGYSGMRKRCRACGYDMRGIQSWVCPECGESVAKGAEAIVGDASIHQQKQEARTRLVRAIGALNPEQRAGRSGAACGRALVGELFPAGSTVMLYAPMVERGEVDLRLLAEGLAARGCRLCVPRVEWEGGTMVPVAVGNLTTDLVDDPAGKGVRMARPGAAEIAAREIDVVVVPGLGFDRSGNRIGRGAGFYDRFLGGLGGVGGGRPVRVAVAFDEQVVDAVPVEGHDARVEWIVTPTELIRAGLAA